MIRADGTRIYADVAYAELHGFRPLLLDLYVPPASADPTTDPPPLVIWIHGGGFHSGDRRILPETYPPNSVFDRLVAAGVAVATVDYRLSAEATFPAQIDDVHAAIEYLRRFAPAYGIDADRIGTWGESAGGALAALAGLTSGQVSAVVAWYPLTDLTRHHADRSDSVEAELLGAAPADGAGVGGERERRDTGDRRRATVSHRSRRCGRRAAAGPERATACRPGRCRRILDAACRAGRRPLLRGLRQHRRSSG